MDFLIRDARPRGEMHPVMKMPDGVGAACQRLIAKGEPSGLLTRTATTEGALLCMPMKSGLRFWNWKGRFVSTY